MSEGDFVTQREFDRVVRSLEGSIREGQQRVDGELRRLTDAINTRVAVPQSDAMALAIHRLADIGEKVVTSPLKKAPDSWTGRLWAIAVLGVVALAGFAIVVKPLLP